MMWLVVISCVLAKSVSATDAVYYRLLVDSFKDTDGDGLGDLQGVTKQLSYIRALGADAVILSPILMRSTDCDKPGTIDFTQIDPRYGDQNALDKLLEKSKKMELKVLITLDVQRVSAASDWFNRSETKTPGYEDWILWKDGTEDQLPMIEEDIDAWIWKSNRNAFYASYNNETILNLCSEGLIETFKGIQCFWLKKGVAGFVITPDFSMDLDCGVQMVKKMSTAAATCARSANMDTPITLLDTALSPGVATKYFGDSNSIISNALTSPESRTTPELALAIHYSVLYCPQDMAPTWPTSSKVGSRIASRYGSEMVDAMNMISLILPGSAIIQQGDELGAADTILEWASTEKCWPNNPMPWAAPFPWDDTVNAGFSTSEPWLPLAPNYRYANAKTEFANDFSHVGVFRVAAAMRKSPAFGPYVEIKRLNDVLAILRWGSSGSLLVVSNLGRSNAEVQPSKIPGLAAEMTVATSSGGSSLSPGTHVSTDKPIKLIPGETILLAGGPRHCGGPGPVDKIANKLSEGWQKLNKYFGNM